MRNYITLNGKNSNEINGLLIQELPPISKPQIRTEVEEIDGRDGDIVTKLGFAAYDKEFTVGLYKDFDINAIIAYFNSEGTVVFSNEPDKYYNYQIIDQIDFERLVRYRTATVRMHCQPFKYSNTEGARTLGNKGTASGEGSFITLDNTPEAQFSKIDPKGNATQATYSGKNLINNSDLSYVYSNVPSANNTLTTISTGIRYATTHPSGSPLVVFKLLDATPYVGKTVRMSANFGTGGSIVMLAVNSDGSSNTVLATGTTSGATISHTITSGDLSGHQYIAYALRLTVAQGTTADFTNLIMTIDNADMSYEPYVGGTPSPNPSYPQAVNTVTGENVVKIEGKNLCPDTSEGYWVGSAGTNAGRTANDSGVAIPVQPNTYYAVSTTTTQARYRCAWSDSTTTIGGASLTTASFFSADNTSGSHTGSSGSHKYLIINATDLSAIQLELGNSASSFEPYQAQEFEVNLGKNLLQPMTGLTNNGLAGTVNTNGTISVAGTATTTYSFITNATTQNIPSGTYTFSDGLEGQTYRCIARFTYADNNYVECDLRNQGAGRSVTLTQTATKCQIRLTNITSGTTYNLTVKPMVQLGSTANAYAPYFTPIELAKIGDYQDRIYKEDSKWYIEKQVGKVVFDGSEKWSLYANKTKTFMTSLGSGVRAMGGLSDHFTKGYAPLFDVNPCFYPFNTANLIFSMPSVADLAGWKTWLASNPTTVYYALAEPVDEEITNETLISQLEALYNQAHAYKGRTHVAAIAQGSNAPHIIEAEVQRSSDGNITNNGNIVSKPTLTIYGSGNIGVSLNGYQILEITLGDEEYITIDTAAMEAYKDTLDNLKNRLVNGDYSKFALRPGSNMIEFSGTVSKCIISKYSRWL